MFDFLKKKLSEGVKKIVDAVAGKKEEAPQKPVEEKLEEKKFIERLEGKISSPQEIEISKEAEHKEIIDFAEAEEKLLEAEEILAPAKPEISEKEEGKTERKYAPVIEDKRILTPEKTIEPTKPKKLGLIEKLKKAIAEKEIEEKDIAPLLEDLQTGLLESDVALEVAEKICADLKSNLVGRSLSRGKVSEIVKDSLRASVREILNQKPIDIFTLAKEKKPLKIIFLGFNGTGKTTTIARLGFLFKEKKLEPVFAAADTWRAAAIEQIEHHGKKLSIPVVKQKYGADPAAVIFDAVKFAESKKLDVVLADTAGRAHTNSALMDEMKKIIRVNKPDLKILVLDSLTGNDAVEQARLFNEAVGVDGMIFTKADVYDKGGALLSAAYTLKKPILFIGVGQDYKHLKEFRAEEVIKNLFE
ncbi:MAG TPA: signal recognition particle-docking protein FtsY [archaeon]|nr:signal recognition particle-docking protein FtsY [archaeon]